MADSEANEDGANEIVQAARDAKARKDAAAIKDREAHAKKWQIGKFGLGVGIGSAAVAAAVLFANREGRSK